MAKTINDYGFSKSRAPESNTYWGRVRAYPANGQIPTKESKRFVHGPDVVLTACSYIPNGNNNYQKTYPSGNVTISFSNTDYRTPQNQHDRTVSITGLDRAVLAALNELNLKAY